MSSRTLPGSTLTMRLAQQPPFIDPEVPVVQDVHRIIADGEYASLSGPPTPGPATAAVTTVTMPAPSGSLPGAGLDRLDADARQRGAPLIRLSSTAGARRDGSGHLR